MSDVEIISFRIEDGVITKVIKARTIAFGSDAVQIFGRRNLEDAVARVANTPVGGKDET